MGTAQSTDAEPELWWHTLLYNAVGAALCFGCVYEYYHPALPPAEQPVTDQNREDLARAAAVKHFKSISLPTSENAALWDAKAFAVVGHYWPMDRSVVGGVRTERPDPNRDDYHVTVPCCVRVLTDNGERTEVREVGYHVTPEGGRYAVVNWSFTHTRPFGLGDRLYCWFSRTLLVPVQCLAIAVGFGLLYGVISAVTQFSLANLIGYPLSCGYFALRGMRLFGVVNSAYLAYVCWESVLAVFAAFVVTVAITTLLLRWLEPRLAATVARLERRNEPVAHYRRYY